VLAARFRAFCKAAQVRHIPPKNLRHTNVTLTESTRLVAPAVAAKRSGHSEAVRRRHYEGTLDELQRAAALPLEVLTEDLEEVG
jgi:integrase